MTGDMGEPLSLHPEVEELKAANEQLRELVVALLAEHDALLHAVRPYLLAMYQTKLGPWELRLLEARCATNRMRRKVEMVQAALNACLVPVMSRIEASLDAEFALWEERMCEAAAKVAAAESHLANLMTPAESKEFKTLYRKLVKALHPDVAVTNNGQTRALWHSVQSAYANGDLAGLRELQELAEQLVPAPSPTDSLAELRAVEDALRSQIAKLAERMEKLRSEPPFNMQDKLEDEEWLESRRAEIEAQIAEVRERREALETYLHSLISEIDGGAWISPN